MYVKPAHRIPHGRLTSKDLRFWGCRKWLSDTLSITVASQLCPLLLHICASPCRETCRMSALGPTPRSMPIFTSSESSPLSLSSQFLTSSQLGMRERGRKQFPRHVRLRARLLKKWKKAEKVKKLERRFIVSFPSQQLPLSLLHK